MELRRSKGHDVHLDAVDRVDPPSDAAAAACSSSLRFLLPDIL